MVRTIAIATLLVACGTDGDGGGGSGSGAGSGSGSGHPATGCPTAFEVCGYRDGGWQATCVDGVVAIDSLNSVLYCDPDDPETVCEIDDGDPGVVHTCAGACADPAKTYLETIDEYQAFDPAALCD